MRKTGSILAMAVVMAASLALSGCVIIADDSGETTRITSIDMIKSDSGLASVRRFSADGAVVQATLWTNCESTDSFEVKLTGAQPAEGFAIGLREGVSCEGDMRDLTLQWSYETLGLASGARVVLQNAVVL